MSSRKLFSGGTNFRGESDSIGRACFLARTRQLTSSAEARNASVNTDELEVEL